MNKLIGDNFGSSKLGEIVKKLSAQYYPQLDELRSNMLSQVDFIKNTYPHDDIAVVPDLCNKLSDEIRAYLHLRETTFVPYLIKVIDKRQHDGDMYNRNCAIKHAEQLSVAHQSHIKVKNALEKVRTIFVPGKKPIYNNVYLILQSHLTLIESSLTNLLLLEEAYIKPELFKDKRI